MLKAAVIGVGSIGRNHARVYSELGSVQLAGVSDLNETAAQATGRRLNTAHYTSFEHLLDTEKPDLVSVCVPTHLHYEVACSVIERGVHLLVEKPIAETVEQASDLIDRAAAAGVKLAVGHIERFNPAVAELKRRLSEGALNRVFRLQTRRLGPFPARIRDVGVVIDLATHDLDLIRYILNTEVVRVYAETAHGINTDREDIVDCVLRTASGAIATLNINWMTPAKIRELFVTGAEGMFVVNMLTQELSFYENDMAPVSQWEPLSVLKGVSEGNMLRYKLVQQEPLRLELENFVNAVRDDRSPLATGADGLQALALALALVRSGAEQRVIEMPAG